MSPVLAALSPSNHPCIGLPWAGTDLDLAPRLQTAEVAGARRHQQGTIRDMGAAS